MAVIKKTTKKGGIPIMSFGRNLVRVRKDKGFTQKALVEKSGVAISQIRRYEADKTSPTLDVILRLVKALGVSIDELAFGKFTGVASRKIVDRELLEQFEMISDMDTEEKNAVKKILEGVIVKKQVEKMMRPKAEKSWSLRFREITDRLAEGAKDYSADEIDEVIDEAVEAVRAKKYANA
jgi:transcriptional regulator with XRE-family HTH domain